MGVTPGGCGRRFLQDYGRLVQFIGTYLYGQGMMEIQVIKRRISPEQNERRDRMFSRARKLMLEQGETEGLISRISALRLKTGKL